VANLKGCKKMNKFVGWKNIKGVKHYVKSDLTFTKNKRQAGRAKALGYWICRGYETEKISISLN
tara:strand:- start:271 stop:462 length:192 start_codon:yes stop_codon:yes gene_type:complete